MQIKIQKKLRDVVGDCEMILETSGEQGGDAGHGAFMSLKIKNLNWANFDIKKLKDDSGCDNELEIVFKGDAEIRAFADILKSCSKIIELTDL